MNLKIDNVNVLSFGITICIILSSVILALSPLIHKISGLSMGITYDLTLTAPLIYLLLIRKKKVPLITVVPFFVLGIILATLLLPDNKQYHLNLVKSYLLPVVETIVVLVILYHVLKTIKAFKETSKNTYDFYFILKESALRSVGFPRIAKILSSEIAMFYYALFSWKKTPPVEKGFTNYKENGITALLGVILFLLMVETIIIHILLIRWNETVAWVIFASSFYAAVQIFGHLKALRQRTSELKDNHLFLKYGLFGDIKVDLRHISRIEFTANTIEDENRIVEKFALLKDMESHNVVIYFTEKQNLERAYGITKDCDTLLLHIDNKEEFKNTINKAIHQDL